MLHRLATATDRTIKLILADLEGLGVDPVAYSSIRYGRTQQIGAALAHLGYDGLQAPSARWPCDNLIIFTSNLSPTHPLEVKESWEIDWQAWGRSVGMI